MHLVQRACVTCPSTIPDHCDPPCGDNQQCSIVFQTCDTCSTAQCIAAPSAPAASTGAPNVGAIVGGVFAAVILIGVACAYKWYRGRRNLAAAAALKRATFEPKPDIVASADTVLNRPDPNINIIIEKADQGPGSPVSGRTFEDGSPVRFEPPENPFSDHASIATASDRATNVIPIGLVTPSSASMLSRATGTSLGANSTSTPASIASSTPSGFTLHPPSESPRSFAFSQNQPQPNGPVRPRRGPEIDMRLDLNRPESTLLPPSAPYAASARTGASGISSRSSMLSTSSSFLNEAPQIVTPKQANFRQVLGVQRAAVVQLGSTPNTSPGVSAAPSLRSQRSASTIGRSAASPDGQGPNPFGDNDAEADDDASLFHDGRPMSAMSDATSIANIASAQRVQILRPQNLNSTTATLAGEGRALLLPSPLSSSSGVYSPTITGRSLAGSNTSTPTGTPRAIDFRTAGQLTPPSQAVPRSFDDLMGAGPPSRPSSLQSFAMTNRTSTADSILESFPFVPPSPISMHHAQPHPSTLQQQQQQRQQQGLGQANLTAGVHGPSSLRTESTQDVGSNGNKPGRMTLGMSTASAASSGLGSFPFQFEGGEGGRSHASTVGPSKLRQQDGDDDDDTATISQHHGDRASLDTLQLSRDLADFPLPIPSAGTPKP
ncbi:hypothetical protein M408DRAFT_332626 [Serendipita vermifera MAFF 305830]|uniref:Membrane anchor Opy2 N-terminal domain-containing protein n=1 Tax=Serendipita vermifera MAFF 305830 TaxID=933852 RepID=A0A0C3ASD3_SERVB|nr:hypothetical protein M408DRAFT_332626 [Serendipita vermifera MAFF 305830]